MSIRTLSSELQYVAKDELNEDPRRIQSDLEHMREWIEKQPHLNNRLDDQILITFLRGCKWSLQKTKEKIDYFYKIRSLLPEFFQNRDPFSPEIQNILSKGIIIPLPKTKTSGGPRICFYNCSNISEDMNAQALCKFFFMMFDILLNEDDNFVVSGIALLSDYEKIPLKLITQVTPGFAKKYVVTCEKVYPVRIRNFIGINTPKVVEGLYNSFIKALFSNKLRNKLLLCTASNIDLVYDKIDKSLLPKEYGGDNGSLDEMAKEWKRKVESYRDWFLQDSKNLSNQTMRFDKLQTYNEEFGMEGSFRQLIID